jgi:hypothetical protein
MRTPPSSLYTKASYPPQLPCSRPASTLGVHPGGGLLAGRLLGNWGWVRELSRAEEPVDRHWTVTVVGAD